MKVAASLSFAVATVVSTVAHAQYTGGVVKIGVLSDMSGVYADLTGAGSVAAAKLAVQDFDSSSHGMKVEIVSADHQNKPDIGSAPRTAPEKLRKTSPSMGLSPERGRS
jgi:branched-chain amino acid transport system substrate-binding protein